MDSTVSRPDIIHSDFASVARTPSCVYFILCHCITHVGSRVHHQSQETKISIIRIPGAPLSQPGPLSSLPASLTLLPVVFCHLCVCVFKVLVIFPWSPCLYSGPRNLVVQVIGSNKGANRVSRQCLRIFLFVKLSVKLEECMWSEIKLDNFAINEQLVPNVQVRRLCKTEHLKWCPIKCA